MSDDELSPDTLERLERAEQLKLDGNHEEALSILEELLLEDPQNVSALEEIADNELSLGQYERAEVASRQAVDLDAQSYTGYYILGFLRSRTEQWEDAVTHLRTANALKPNNPEILRCLGWALFNGGQRAQGAVTLERALNLDSDSTLTLCDLGVAHLQLQNFQKAKVLFQRVLELDGENLRAKECLEILDRLMKFSAQSEVKRI
jgi:tetratricopeptide (TPR) repeat protein